MYTPSFGRLLRSSAASMFILAALLLGTAGRVKADPSPTSAARIIGVVNETISVIPLRYSEARQIIPSRYSISNAYLDFLPQWKDWYPLVLEIAVNSNLSFAGQGQPTFSSVRFTFPFVTFANGTSFRYETGWIVEPLQSVIDEAQGFGLSTLIPAQFAPAAPHAYSYSEKEIQCFGQTESSASRPQEATSTDSGTDVYFRAKHCPSANPYEIPLSFYENVTTQIINTGGNQCAIVTRDFSAPVAAELMVVQSDINLTHGPAPGVGSWTGVNGIQIATPFTETYVNCTET